jgi:hypothetical protein
VSGAPVTALLPEWTALLRRRPSFGETLAPFGRVIAAWDSEPAAWLTPLACTAERAAAAWTTGTPLLADAPPSIPADRLEPLLGPALDVIDPIEDARPFAEAWDRGEISPADLLPDVVSGCSRTRALQERCRLTQHAMTFLAIAGLRPALRRYFERSRPLVDPRLWDRGLCPCCGSPPGFADLLEDGRRQLACHLCDARWTLARLVCPFCDTRTSSDVVRLIAEDADEGYAIVACRACRGYIKELDRRARWNAGSAIVEDWGSPHLDLIAHRQQYWRPMPTLIQLTAGHEDGNATP